MVTELKVWTFIFPTKYVIPKSEQSLAIGQVSICTCGPAQTLLTIETEG